MSQDVFTTNQNRIIALAGLIQAVSLVNDLATTGNMNSASGKACINSLFAFQPNNTLEVYGHLEDLEFGLSQLRALLAGNLNTANKHIMQYAVGVNGLARKLLRKNSTLSNISQKLGEAEHKVEHFGVLHDNTLGFLADIYSANISTFNQRIQVKGEYTFLQQERIANQIRALLLAAVRSSILWKQNGGNFWHLLFAKGKLNSDLDVLLQKIKK